MKKIGITLIIIIALALIVPAAASAQGDGEELLLGLTRNFGYGGLGKIQGNFTLKISDPPAELDRVEFYIDGVMTSTAKEEPFHYKFHTSEFEDGEHQMNAIGYLADGTMIQSRLITKVFLSSEQARGETQSLFIPLLIGISVLTVLGVSVPLLINKDKDFVLGKYGPAGGVVCPRCKLPFSRSLFSPNLLVGKLVRCPHCGKISIQARASQSRLQEAEARFRNKDKTGIIQHDDGDLHKLIEDSRFEE
jgi:DNA-directed RNA polymerase subunit RPC12/RpoP